MECRDEMSSMNIFANMLWLTSKRLPLTIEWTSDVPEILATYNKLRSVTRFALRYASFNLEDWINEIYNTTVQFLGYLDLLQQLNQILTINISELTRFNSKI